MGVVRSAAAGVSLAGVSAGAGHEARGTARPSRDAADEGVQNPVTISASADPVCSCGGSAGGDRDSPLSARSRGVNQVSSAGDGSVSAAGRAC